MNSNAISEHLETLGSTARQVAQTLQQQGLQGYTGSSMMCPLAHYLHRLGYEKARVTQNAVYFDGLTTRVLLPKACCEFVFSFDAGEFPECDTLAIEAGRRSQRTPKK